MPGLDMTTMLAAMRKAEEGTGWEGVEVVRVGSQRSQGKSITNSYAPGNATLPIQAAAMLHSLKHSPSRYSLC